MKIIKGDNVKVISGKDRGKTGVVSAAFPTTGKIAIEGINKFKKNARPRREGERGQLVEVSRPLAADKVQLICPSCKQPTRIGSRLEGNRKVRYCKKCKSTI
jgi:large subunit ribosomal protein L24